MSDSGVKITIFDNGPIEVIGPVTVINEKGKAFEVTEGEPVYFCRCGESAEKPFCDGSHDNCEFQSKLT